MKILVGFVTQALILLTVLSCTRFKENSTTATVLAVNGEKLSAGDFSKLLAKKLKNFDALAAKDPTNIKRTKDMILDEFIVDGLLRQLAQSKGLTISNEELEKEFEKVRKSYPDDLSFKSAIAEKGTSLTDWRDSLRKSLLVNKAFEIVSPPLSSDEITKTAHEYYAEHKDEFQRPPQIRIKQIVVAKRDDAERILHALKSGSSFEELAKKYSISPDSAHGGDIDFISKGIVPAFDSAFNLHPGQLSVIINSSYGFHILKLVDKRSAMLLNFEQSKGKIVQRITSRKQQEAFNRWLENAVKTAKIERNDTLLNRLSVHTEGTQE